ncbi:hypothetical protein GJU39_08755 [Pedobacter petrophilus]|uniref:Uncharacterized protein n=1 Tax=Pedobacter petrophilus TaxID=1908241 RepID=A0A7K0FX33_9SPHI|nr:hypothetical protein [Pedobacter petrophilus]MRX76177.1 hypothetical protein [Pedobacter petrophilus]
MMNIRSNFFVKKFSVFIVLLAICFCGCKRIVKSDDSEDSTVDDIEEVSKVEYQRIMSLKLPLKTVLIDKIYSLTIPEGCDFEVEKVTPEEVVLGNIDLAKIDTSFLSINLGDFFSKNEGLYSEQVYFIPANDSKRFSIADLKKGDERIDAVYYEDENSIIYDQGETFFTYNIQYDEAKKCFLFYKAEISWTQKYPKKQKLELAVHLLKHAKSLTATNYPPAKFTSWNEYVQNMPVLEVNWVNNMFRKIEKELKFFLDPNDQVSPRTPGNYTFVELFSPSQEALLSFYKSIDQIKNNQVIEPDYNSSQLILNLNSQYAYQLKEETGCYVVTNSSKVNDGYSAHTFTTVFCPVDYKGRNFMLKTDKELTPSNADFFVKMFSHFSKHYTLNTTVNP